MRDLLERTENDVDDFITQMEELFHQHPDDEEGMYNNNDL